MHWRAYWKLCDSLSPDHRKIAHHFTPSVTFERAKLIYSQVCFNISRHFSNLGKIFSEMDVKAIDKALQEIIKSRLNC